ncbi:rhamnogalacturonan lyase [Prevotella sp. E13-27]|uniref:rhamnogalacturonan lyase n=1 Tax=Prevotella sp. E13-27 TaxID=2938122 RepID=UPI00200A72E2|nr:rhamnogalacturonan lyase [Prevotella sp. E13-27]MCK8621558.1 rhamnogalacturonan lyase [Prevotella sp. E13-27]
MKRSVFLIAISLLLTSISVAQVTTPLAIRRGVWGEVLMRHVMAVPQSASGSKYLVSWRMLATDDDYTTFDVLRNGEVVASDINNSTNFLDTKGSNTAKYSIVTKRNGEKVSTTDAITPWQGIYNTLKLDRPAGGTFHDSDYTYSPNDCSVADVDGDGRYEIVVKWEPSNPADNSQGGFTGPTIFDCYKILETDGKMTAQKLWRIDMGHNIRSGPHYVPFLFYDFDGDGKAEFIVKTGPGTKDGAGNYITEAADEAVIKATDNEKEYLNGGGQVMYGPEFLTVFSGQDGHAIHTVYYNPNRGCFVGGAPELRTDLWGDDYGNRSERYLATVAHLDAQNPTHASAVMCRGYYTRSYLWAVDFDGSKLSTRWRHASISSKTAMKTEGNGEKDVRTYAHATYANTNFTTAYAQGNHNLSCADVDGDGMDEVIYGSAAIDHDGNLLWSTGLCHGDALHVSDLMPDRPGLEVFQIHEDPPFGMHVCDAATGELLIHMTGDGDTARGIAADFTEERGQEFSCFGNGSLYNATTGSVVGGAPEQNFRIYWDGDIYEEIFNGIGNYHNQPYLVKYNQGRIGVDGRNLYELGYSVTCNGTKNSPCLQADIFGDWREEIIVFNNEDKQTLNIFSTAHETAARVPCLMTDHVYRLGITWQNSGYNQPPHLGYYLPDSTAARFTVTSLAGEAAGAVTIHYNNCTGATLQKVVLMDNTEVAADNFILTQDEKLCTLTLSGQTAVKDISYIVVNPIKPSNGLKNAVAISINGEVPSGIENITPTFSKGEGAVYDLQGRKVDVTKMRGIYIKNGKKYVIL